MTIQIEEGKYYRTRDGRKVGPLRFSRVNDAEDRRWATAPGFVEAHWYTQFNPAHYAGDYANACSLRETVDDLMEEWVDEPEVAHDPVEHPKHYTGHPSGVECIAVTEHMNFCLGNAVKYIWRAGEKGDALTDLKKARWYIDREIERLSKKA